MNFTLKTQIGTIAIVLISSFFTSAVTAAPAAPAIRTPGKPAAQPAPAISRETPPPATTATTEPAPQPAVSAPTAKTEPAVAAPPQTEHKVLRSHINQRSQVHRPSRRLRLLIPATKPVPPPQQRNRKQQKRQRPNRLQQINKAPPLCRAIPSASRTKRKTTIPCCPKQQPGNWTLPWRT